MARDANTEAEFVNLLRIPGINSQPELEFLNNL
jgi:hypothetical protein